MILDIITRWLLEPANVMWLVQMLSMLLFIYVLSFLEGRFYNRALERLKQTSKVWDDALVISLHQPCRLLIWGVGLSYVVQHAPKIFSVSILSESMEGIRVFLVIVAGVLFLYKLTGQIEQNLARVEPDKKSFDPATAKVIGRALRTILLLLFGLMAMNAIGIDISGLLTFGGVGTLVIGLAGKELLSNFFGGLFIIWDKPFTVGEWIRLPDKNLEGVVEEIGWRMTRMRTFDRRPMFVPNATFSSVAIENPSRMYNRRIKHNVGVRYDDAKRIPGIVEDIRAMLREHPDIDQRQFMMVHLLEFGPSSLDISIYCFTKTTNWEAFRDVQEDVFLRVIEIIEKHGGECAFPTRTLHVPEPVTMDQKEHLSTT
ncbi:MAG: mechanosensitive ion channel protein MscS [Legionellales bacterium]|nr:mechanosensitive ion channel protein MscS [Legionellales bacterium]|tara:strand:+ start:881 stop:1993 length:1113 start_codon:yes stop_codon:yes gene_type:complete